MPLFTVQLIGSNALTGSANRKPRHCLSNGGGSLGLYSGSLGLYSGSLGLYSGSLGLYSGSLGLS